MLNGDALRFYAAPGPLTATESHGSELEELPRGLGELVRTVHGLGIYDVVAPDFYGIEVPDARAQEIHDRSIEEMLDGLLALDGSSLVEARPPDRRLFMRCGGFTKLLVSALRSQHVPARARCGFAAYLNPGNFEDHWIAEVWDAREERWRLVDAQMDDVWRERLHVEDDVLDLSHDRFITATDAWYRCRSGVADAQRFGISFAGLHGQAFVAGSLVRDLAALNKVELLPWDVWGAIPAPDDHLDDQQLAFFDALADLVRDPDGNFAEIRERYDNDDAVRMPGAVRNALRQQQEAVPV